jgi:hypothetical protein
MSALGVNTHPCSWVIDVIVEKLGNGTAADRILFIPDREDQLGYVDTDESKVYLITVQEAKVVPASSANADSRRELRMPRVDVRYEDGSIEAS